MKECKGYKQQANHAGTDMERMRAPLRDTRNNEAEASSSSRKPDTIMVFHAHCHACIVLMSLIFMIQLACQDDLRYPTLSAHQ
jgi:hypothetical protein